MANLYSVKPTPRIRALVWLLAALAVLVTPALLFAHAHLVRASPAMDGQVDSPPPALNLWFSEQPELRFTSIQLLDSAGTQVSLGPIAKLGSDSMAVTAPIPNPLAPGKYTVSWRTAASDGHPSSGKYSFIVTAAASAAPPIVTAPAVADTNRVKSNAPVTSSPYAGFSPAFRWAELVGLLTLVGALVFRLFVLREARHPSAINDDAAERARRFANALLGLFVVAFVWRLAAESDLILTANTARFSAMMAVVRDTQWGKGWLVGAIGALITAIGLHFGARSLNGWIAAGIGVVAMCVAEALTGHAGALPRHTALAIATDVAHVLSAGGWLGGLAVVLLAGLPATRLAPAEDQTAEGQRLVRAYHNSATQCVALLLITALIASWLRLGAFSDLWTTEYGSMLFRKIIFVIIALGFGWYHWNFMVKPDWSEGTRGRFVRTATGELLVGAVILGLTALLISMALPNT